MSRRVFVFAVLISVIGCSTRNFVVKPEEVPKLNDAKWTIKAEPRR